MIAQYRDPARGGCSAPRGLRTQPGAQAPAGDDAVAGLFSVSPVFCPIVALFTADMLVTLLSSATGPRRCHRAAGTVKNAYTGPDCALCGALRRGRLPLRRSHGRARRFGNRGFRRQRAMTAVARFDILGKGLPAPRVQWHEHPHGHRREDRASPCRKAEACVRIRFYGG